MSFQAAECPTCHRQIQVPIDIPNPACPYCGTGVGQASAAPAASVATLMGMAQTAALAGNNEEALSYFNRVLESDPRNSDAWIGKGKAAGWQSTLANFRVSEMLVAFGHAIANADPDAKSPVVQSLVLEANHLIVTIYGIARNHMLEFVSLANSWSEYLMRMSQMLDSLEIVISWDDNDRTTLENIIHICKDNIEGVNYRDQFDYNSSKTWTLSPEYEQFLQSKMDSAAAKLKTIDSTYEAPILQKNRAEDCFVITATLGDSQHPDVIFLQDFRDYWLSCLKWGKIAIHIYYRYGPRAANYISKSRKRRAVSHQIIVRPMVWIATRLTRSAPPRHP